MRKKREHWSTRVHFAKNQSGQSYARTVIPRQIWQKVLLLKPGSQVVVWDFAGDTAMLKKMEKKE